MTEKLTFNFPTYLKESFEAKLLKTNKKLAKIEGSVPVEVLSQTKKDCLVGQNAYGDNIYENRTEISINVPVNLKHDGFTYLGTSVNSEGMLSYHNLQLPAKELMKKDHFKCDHCGKTHKARKVVHYFEKECEVLGIGSTCAQQFFGIDLHRALQVFTREVVEVYGDEYIDVEKLRGGLRNYTREKDLGTVLRAIVYAYKEDNVYHKRDAYGHSKTHSAVQEGLNSIDKKVIAEVKKATKGFSFKNLYAKLKDKYADSDTSNSFNANIVANVFENGEVRKQLPAKAVGLLTYIVYQELNDTPKKKAEKKLDLHYPNNIGDKKVAFEGEVVYSAQYANTYGYNSTCYNTLVIMETSKGLVKFYSTIMNEQEKGTKLSLVGTVKSFDTDKKGRKVTVFTRVQEAPTQEEEDQKKQDQKERAKKRNKVKKSFAFPKDVTVEDLEGVDENDNGYKKLSFNNGSYTISVSFSMEWGRIVWVSFNLIGEDGHTKQSVVGHAQARNYKRALSNVLANIVEYEPEILESC